MKYRLKLNHCFFDGRVISDSMVNQYKNIEHTRVDINGKHYKRKALIQRIPSKLWFKIYI